MRGLAPQVPGAASGARQTRRVAELDPESRRYWGPQAKILMFASPSNAQP